MGYPFRRREEAQAGALPSTPFTASWYWTGTVFGLSANIAGL
jgi:hypothetical protein